jgi:hypothetical protein
MEDEECEHLARFLQIASKMLALLLVLLIAVDH